MSAPSQSSALRPASTAELAEILAADDRPLEPVGTGSKRAIGRPVEGDVLELELLSGVVDYRPSELVLTACAATPLAELGSLLAEHRQRLAFEPPDLAQLLGSGATRQSIGGVLAANLSGSRRVSAGAARDHFLGVTAVNGAGQTFKAGGKVVKNVTGYDLTKVIAGSWGSLAVMTEVTLKVVPQAETEVTLILPDETPVAAVHTLSQALGSPHEVSSAAFDPWRGSALRLEGIAASVSAREQALLGELGSPQVERLEGDESHAYWARQAGAEALSEWPVVWRLSVPPSDAPRVVEAIAPERYLLDWGGGLIWAAFKSVDSTRVRGALREGHAFLIKAPPDSRTCRQQPPSAAMEQVLHKLRQAFDPAGRLNPGRMD
ncbi:MAG TPA: FAD-binding protein [Gammaproteobacteria bacterium]|jgi:glycolate oxidase FAD binding subunit